MAREKITGFLTDLAGLFGHAAIRVGHAQQLKRSFEKIEDTLIAEFGIDPHHLRIDAAMKDFLELDGPELDNEDLIQERFNRKLPRFGVVDGADAISFQRLKDPARLQAKLATDNRNTHDTFGMQKFVSADVMRRVERLQNPRDPLSKAFKEKGIEISVDNYLAKPKSHGYRGIHVNFTCPGNKNWTESMEMQFLLIGSMKTYILTRNPYEAYRVLKEAVEAEKGENQNNWSQQDRNLIYPLRRYIKALYEADTYEAGAMSMLNVDHARPRYKTAAEAHAGAAQLRPRVLDVVSQLQAYDYDARLLLEYEDDILESLKAKHGPLSKDEDWGYLPP